MRRFLIILLLVATVARGGFDHYPATVETPFSMGMISNLVAAIDERSKASANFGVGGFDLVVDYVVEAGTTNNVETFVEWDFSGDDFIETTNIVTNTYVNYVTVRRTNQWAEWVWTTNGVTVTNLPHLTHAMMTSIDTRLEDLGRDFVPHWLLTNESAYGWLTSSQVIAGVTNHYDDIPTGGEAEWSPWLQHLGIGFVTNIQTNIWGLLTTGTVGRLTKQAPTTQTWMLAEVGRFPSWRVDDLSTEADGEYRVRYGYDPFAGDSLTTQNSNLYTFTLSTSTVMDITSPTLVEWWRTLNVRASVGSNFYDPRVGASSTVTGSVARPSTNWGYILGAAFDSYNLSNHHPQAWCVGTGDAITVTFQGLVHNPTNQFLATYSTQETVTVTGTNPVQLVNFWRSVTNVSAVSTIPNTGQTVVIGYRGSFPLYGSLPYYFDHQAYNERVALLDGYRWTKRTVANTGGVTTAKTIDTFRGQYGHYFDSVGMITQSGDGEGSCTIDEPTGEAYDAGAYTLDALRASATVSQTVENVRGHDGASLTYGREQTVEDDFATASAYYECILNGDLGDEALRECQRIGYEGFSMANENSINAGYTEVSSVVYLVSATRATNQVATAELYYSISVDDREREHDVGDPQLGTTSYSFDTSYCCDDFCLRTCGCGPCPGYTEADTRGDNSSITTYTERPPNLAGVRWIEHGTATKATGATGAEWPVSFAIETDDLNTSHEAKSGTATWTGSGGGANNNRTTTTTITFDGAEYRYGMDEAKALFKWQFENTLP